MSDFTKGSWTYTTSNFSDRIHLEGQPEVCIAETGNWLVHEKAEQHANARLIASAPDLLAFAQAHDAYMLAAGYEGPESDALHPAAAENWRLCRAVISKATGGAGHD